MPMTTPVPDGPGAGTLHQPRPASMTLGAEERVLRRISQPQRESPYPTVDIPDDLQHQPQCCTACRRIGQVAQLYWRNALTANSAPARRLMEKQGGGVAIHLIRLLINCSCRTRSLNLPSLYSK